MLESWLSKDLIFTKSKNSIPKGTYGELTIRIGLQTDVIPKQRLMLGNLLYCRHSEIHFQTQVYVAH